MSSSVLDLAEIRAHLAQYDGGWPDDWPLPAVTFGETCADLCDEVEHLRARIEVAERVVEATRKRLKERTRETFIEVEEALRAYDEGAGR